MGQVTLGAQTKWCWYWRLRAGGSGQQQRQGDNGTEDNPAESQIHVSLSFLG